MTDIGVKVAIFVPRGRFGWSNLTNILLGERVADDPLNETGRLSRFRFPLGEPLGKPLDFLGKDSVVVSAENLLCECRV